MPPRDLPSWLDYLERLHPVAIELGLDRVRAVRDRLGLQQLPFRVLTVGGTSRVLFFATMAGLAAGLAHGLARKFIHNAFIRNVLFGAFCIAFTWRAGLA